MGEQDATGTGLTYADAGVDVDAGNRLVDRIKPLAASTRRVGADAALGGFGGLFDLAACKFKDPVLVSANDGVGTKLKIAIETGQHGTVGIDLVAMCVNDLIVQGAEPLFFLDYFASGKLELDTAEAVIAGIADGCRQANCALIGGETAEMPGLYAAGDYDLAGFAVGAVERDGILPRATMAEGDVLIALSSSGVHSNGFSLVRRVVEKARLSWDHIAPFDPERTLGAALLEPTRIYVRAVLAALRSNEIKGLAHITGGGITENLPRVLPDHLGASINLDAVRTLPVFSWLAQVGGVAEKEMLRTFNCGVGMIVVAAPHAAENVIDILTQAGESASIIGELTQRQPEPVNYTGTLRF